MALAGESGAHCIGRQALACRELSQPLANVGDRTTGRVELRNGITAMVLHGCTV